MERVLPVSAPGGGGGAEGFSELTNEVGLILPADSLGDRGKRVVGMNEARRGLGEADGGDPVADGVAGLLFDGRGDVGGCAAHGGCHVS